MTADLLTRIFSLADHYGKKVYAVVSNMTIALERRDLMKRTGCVVCNDQEAGILFSEDYHDMEPEILAPIIHERAIKAGYGSVVVTMGEKGAVYTDGKDFGVCPPLRTHVVETCFFRHRFKRICLSKIPAGRIRISYRMKTVVTHQLCYGCF